MAKNDNFQKYSIALEMATARMNDFYVQLQNRIVELEQKVEKMDQTLNAMDKLYFKRSGFIRRIFNG